MEQTDGSCCKVQENLVLDTAGETTSAYIKAFHCKVCGRRHYKLGAKPIVIDLGAANK